MREGQGVVPGPRRGLFPALMATCAGLAIWSGLGADDKATWAFEGGCPVRC